MMIGSHFPFVKKFALWILSKYSTAEGQDGWKMQMLFFSSANFFFLVVETTLSNIRVLYFSPGSYRVVKKLLISAWLCRVALGCAESRLVVLGSGGELRLVAASYVWLCLVALGCAWLRLVAQSYAWFQQLHSVVLSCVELSPTQGVWVIHKAIFWLANRGS